MQTNNQLREALKQAKEIARTIYSTSDKGSPHEDLAEKIVEIVSAALAAPTRNCEVGTAEEQAERYGRYCDKFTTDSMHCESCPCCGKILLGKCEFAWAQMPYEEGGNNGTL